MYHSGQFGLINIQLVRTHWLNLGGTYVNISRCKANISQELM